VLGEEWIKSEVPDVAEQVNKASRVIWINQLAAWSQWMECK